MKYIVTFVLAFAIGFGIYEAHQPCTLSFESHKGVNLGQPYPTYSHCGMFSSPPVQVTDIYGKPLK
jgi:hypothetical protein